jgi:hypothetical protein
MNSIVLSSSTIYHDDIYDNHCHSKVYHNTHDGVDNRYCHSKDWSLHSHRDGFGGSIAAIALVFAAPTAAAAVAAAIAAAAAVAAAIAAVAVAIAIAASPESVVW